MGTLARASISCMRSCKYCLAAHAAHSPATRASKSIAADRLNLNRRMRPPWGLFNMMDIQGCTRRPRLRKQNQAGCLSAPGIVGGQASHEGFGLPAFGAQLLTNRSEEHTSELQSLMRIQYAVFCLKKKQTQS